MWKFKVSKFKNAAPQLPKKERWISDLSIGRLMASHGNHIAASGSLMAFNVEAQGGSCLAVLPLTAQGRQSKTMPLLRAHAGFVSDLAFSPFDDTLLATGSFDCTVKLWDLPVDGLTEDITNPTMMVTTEERPIANVVWHPVANETLTVSAGHMLKIWDVSQGQAVPRFVISDHEDDIQSTSWKADGTLVATSCKDKKLRVIDPRAQNVVKTWDGYPGLRDSRVVWIGTQDKVLVFGYDRSHQRCISLYDLNNLSSALDSKDLDSNTGTIMPLYDADTGMLFLPGKGDTNLRFLEILEKDPYLTEGVGDGVPQMMGATKVPKRVLDVMNGEVNRLLLLTQNAVVPVPYQVPRKSYTEFHADIFPDTPCNVPAMTVDEWCSGMNEQLAKMSLNPAKRDSQSVTPKPVKAKPAPQQQEISKQPEVVTKEPTKYEPAVAKQPAENGSVSMATNHHEQDTKAEQIRQTADKAAAESEPLSDKSAHTVVTSSDFEKPDGTHVSFAAVSLSPVKITPPVEIPEHHIQVLHHNIDSERHEVKTITSQSLTSQSVAEQSETQSQKPVEPAVVIPQEPVVIRRAKKASSFTGVRHSKFRHLVGKPAHKSLHIDNIRNLSKSMPGESDGFHANKERCAVPLAGPGGLVTVLELSRTGRLPDTGVPVIQNGSTLMDFAWDPFDNARLVTACDNAKINVWQIPDGGLTETVEEPLFSLIGHTEKIYTIAFHPLAKDVLASASYDGTIRIWDLESAQEVIQIDTEDQQVMCMSWSGDGRHLATLSKDTLIRVYSPREMQELVAQGPGPSGTRGGRLAWVCNDKFLAVSGFDRGSSRQLTLYDVFDLSSGRIAMQELDTSPSILFMHYDEDSGTIFLYGKGDCSVYAYEVVDDEPYLFALSTYKAEGLHQALSFLPKSEVNVKAVEFAKAFRLTTTSIEPLSFSVPRVKKNLFQDDLYPDTKVTWEPCLTSSEWFNGHNERPRTISMQPEGMDVLSAVPEEAPKSRKYDSFDPEKYKSDEQKKEELINAMVDQLEDKQSQPLPQDLMEGVDSDEWSDD